MNAEKSTIFPTISLQQAGVEHRPEAAHQQEIEQPTSEDTQRYQHLKPMGSILLESPSCSELRVSFDFEPKIKEIMPFNPIFSSSKKRSYLKQGDAKHNPKNNTSTHIEKRVLKFEIKDKSLILDRRMTKMVKQKAKKYSALIPSSNTIVLKYKRKEDMEVDLRSLGLTPKTYIENKLIVHNLSFKETEESVSRFFGQFAEVEKVVLEKNSKGLCVGKGVVTFSTAFYSGQEKKLYDLRMNGRLLRIERIKKQVLNRTRLFISHIKKNLKIADLRSILKKEGFVPKSVKIDLNDNRNKGYGFVEFQTPEQAESFVKSYSKLKELLGPGSFVEYSQEKQDKSRK
ncbi:uncharacterized protein VICG_00810 [Vittaforma corneae ATCC 50505]|uniref:RRM domain-containing protein n=1 Tax=Vittaforma corneae (strain ATCC 50505) TaxID=993615 RepID=L2GPE0_VITCO|nr:uncharacterized protein VICG_00810 [Vittaforma corneae ATCC 50505]ELA42167.1 hypothetical protein VICG_00810 [Vittaforma corneae ATCC 50505]